MKTKSRMFLLTFLFLGICVLSYLGVSLLINDNPIRLQNNRLFSYHGDDSFYTLKDTPSPGEIQKLDAPDRKEIGPLPEGKFIVAYTQNGTGTFEKQYEYPYYVDEPYWTNEPYYDEYGYLDYRRVTHFRRKTYWSIGYEQKKYKYLRNFSIYDISDQISFFESEDSVYNRLKDEFVSKLSGYKHWEFNPIDYKSSSIKFNYRDLYTNRGKAISYITVSQEGIKTIRSIFYANKKVYVLEVQANYHTAKLANKFLANITTLNLSDYNKEIIIKMICCLLVLIFMVCLFVVYRIRPYKETLVKNKQAWKLYKYAISMAILNTLIVLLIIFRLLSNSDFQFVYYERRYIELNVFAYLMTATIIGMNLLICTSLYIKSRKDYRFDYLIHDRLISYFDFRLDNNKEKKALVLFLYYPMFIMGSLPLGILSLVYVIPFSFIIFVAVEIRHLYRWINKDVVSTLPITGQFLDYYVVLDLKRDANKDEIEKAFYSAMAKYNFAAGNPLYGEQFYYEIQEAYAVLGSINQLRPEYDKEYEAYKVNTDTVYSYSNKQLENEILNIRNKLYKAKSKGNYRTINIIIVSFVLFFVIALFVLRSIVTISSLYEENNTYSEDTQWPVGDFDIDI